jgi:hypothetical protein
MKLYRRLYAIYILYSVPVCSVGQFIHDCRCLTVLLISDEVYTCKQSLFLIYYVVYSEIFKYVFAVLFPYINYEVHVRSFC